jgi:hypothetical protein
LPFPAFLIIKIKRNKVLRVSMYQIQIILECITLDHFNSVEYGMYSNILY